MPRRPVARLASAAAVLALAACGTSTGGVTPPPPSETVRLVEVLSGLESPVGLTAPPRDTRLFVVEQPGRIRVVENGVLLPEPFLDITARVGAGGERGLLGLAFHPSYAANGEFFVNFTDRAGDTRVERFRVGAEANRADPASAELVIGIDQPFSNHNGGHLAFGPDGMLWIGMGDGGSGGDPQGHGQNPLSLLGKMLRLDVDGARPYAIPAGNPFAGRTDARPEIWASGLRNPWRFSFDRSTGTLFVADVGQSAWEEVNAVAPTAAGLNYGWNVMEGAHCFAAASCDREGKVLPVLEYGHEGGACSVTGGYVYRGTTVALLAGRYVYGDFCAGFIRSFRLENGAAADPRTHPVGDVGNILSFGEDSRGELYVLTASGRVYRFAEGS